MKYREELIKTANLMVAEGKGILAADESNPTCGKRFDLINLESSEHSRRRYRNNNKRNRKNITRRFKTRYR